MKASCPLELGPMVGYWIARPSSGLSPGLYRDFFLNTTWGQKLSSMSSSCIGLATCESELNFNFKHMSDSNNLV